MLNAAAWLYAGAELASELGAETGDLEQFKIAANLTSTARQHELAAWELASREAKAHPKKDPRAWLRTPSNGASRPLPTSTSSSAPSDTLTAQRDAANGDSP